MKKYQKLQIENEDETNIEQILKQKEKALLQKRYEFPSMDSLTNLNTTGKCMISESNIMNSQSQKSLMNLDQSSILDFSAHHSKHIPHSANNLSHMKSIVLNKRLAYIEKTSFEDAQKKIFERHLNHISKQNNVLDKLRDHLPTLSSEFNIKENSNNNSKNGLSLPDIKQTINSGHNIIEQNGMKQQKKSFKYISPSPSQNKLDSLQDIQKNNQYSKSVQPTQRKKINHEYNQVKINSNNSNNNDFMNQLMKQLSVKKNIKSHNNINSVTLQTVQSPSSKNNNDQLQSFNVNSMTNNNNANNGNDEMNESNNNNNNNDIHIGELSKLSQANNELNTHRKVSEMFIPQTKRSSDRSYFQNTPTTNKNNTNMTFDQLTNQLQRSMRNAKRGPNFYSFEDSYCNGQINSNIEDKFNFFKKTPVGAIVTISKRNIILAKDGGAIAQGFAGIGGVAITSPQSNRNNINFTSSLSPTKDFVKNNNINQDKSNQNHSMSQYFQQQQQQQQQQNNSIFQSKKEEDLKQKQLSSQMKQPNTLQINNQYIDILKKQALISRINRNNQEQKFSSMSKRMNQFFSNQDNFIIYERYVLLCRHFKRFIDVLFKLEKNLNKNINYITRLIGNKHYLLNEIVDEQFHYVNFNAIEALENTLINENIVKTYFKVDQDLKTILQEYYIKDLSYINGQFEIYLNNQQIIQSSKISEIIQAEFQMIKQKEKDLIFDQYDNNGIQNIHYKKSYQFFNDYLYNIHPRRNTYKEIQEFEKNFGSFQHLSQIDRDIFQNLEKSYNKIRSSNK